MHKLTRSQIEAFLRKYATDKTVLDIGSGGLEYPEIFPNTRTLDIDPARNPHVIADAHELPFPDNSQEVILCTSVLEHLKDPGAALREMYRVLKPGGSLILTTVFIFPVHDAPGDFWRFTPYGLRYLLEGWQIDEFTTDGGCFRSLAIQLQRIIFQSDVRGGKITKGFIWLIALLFLKMDRFIIRQYGDIRRSAVEPMLLPSGLFAHCRKPTVA